MAYVYPRLPRSVALQTWEMRVEEFVAGGESPAALNGDAGIDPLATFDPTGMRVTREILEKLRVDVLEAACDSGFPLPANPDAYRTFEMKVGRILLETAELMPGEGGQPDIWSHMALVLLPDVAFWRWPDPEGHRKERFIGGIRQLRNVFEVCWFRALVLDDPNRPDADDRLHLMAPLTQDAMVAIVERPSLARCRPLARSLARAFPDVEQDPGSLSVENAFRDLSKRMILHGAVVNFDVLEESEIFALVLQQLEIVRGSSQPASVARGSSSPSTSSGPSRPVPRALPEIRSEDSRSEPGEEMEATAATAVAEQARSGYEEAGVALAPSGYEDHEFWGPFYNAGVPEFPEFERCTPTQGVKIGPYLFQGVQADVRHAKNSNRVRLLDGSIVVDRDEFIQKMGPHVEFNAKGSITINSAPKEEQKTWSMPRRVFETLGVYRKLKEYVKSRMG